MVLHNRYFTFGIKNLDLKAVCRKSISILLSIFETVASGVPSKSQKSLICGGVRQTITLKSPGKGAPPLNEGGRGGEHRLGF
jgi:hypothetical protein